jgi:hypothetical protein
MDIPIDGKGLQLRSEISCLRRVGRLFCVIVLLLVGLIPVTSYAQKPLQTKPPGSEPVPEPAIPAILAAFDKYEVVAMPEGEGWEDQGDFILTLIRTPAFPDKVNDIEVECGNSLYQPVLDRYIAGDDVPFTEVRKVWRNTTQPACGASGFFEEFFPVVRAVNQKLPPAKRLRVLAGDPPIDWNQVKTFQDILKFAHRNDSIASVMEKEVLSKHRKALMLFGTMHLMHRTNSAVSIYEKQYPNVTFVISDLILFDMNSPDRSSGPLASWPTPSIARTKGTWLGALDLGHFLPPPFIIDKDCNLHHELPKDLQKPMADLVDAVLYLGPQDLRLREKMPADIVLDVDYRTESLQREALFPGHVPGVPTGATLKERNQQILNEAENPIFVVPAPPDPKPVVQDCLDRKNRGGEPQ